MPHDKSGTMLAINDVVNVPCVVKSITTGEEYCNISVETVEPMYPGTSKNFITLNAKQVVKVED